MIIGSTLTIAQPAVAEASPSLASRLGSGLGRVAGSIARGIGGAIAWIFTMPSTVQAPTLLPVDTSRNPDPEDNKPDTSENKQEAVGYIPPPRNLPAFPGAKRARPKAGRARWVDDDGYIYEWDSQHGRVEKYDRRGNHLGEFDPNTGIQTKPPKKGRTTPP